MALKSEQSRNTCIVILCMILTCGAQKWKQETSRWDSKGHTNGKTCSNLTQPLSEALGDLYRQFNSLKDELGRLTSKSDSVEGFVDDLKQGRFALPQRPVQRVPPGVGLRSPLRAQRRPPYRGTVQEPTLIRARRRGPQRP
ncbi:hypothetical protein JOQ06_010089 [Pogonophryne albipinna]|uniref:Uncharacterized protein n=1 Tax=Pogonophryne albipinna TaxID=1090488 RepID=A0AAD6AV74_9TELE|nr:hypothetical protein JOQ06_010089 [Pogonophryne albipinna]